MRAPEVRNLPNADADEHPEVPDGKLDGQWKYCRPALPTDAMGDGEDRDGVGRKRRDDAGEERGERYGLPPEPREAQQGLSLAGASPAELLLPKRPPVGGRIGRHERGGLVDRPPAVPEQLVRQDTVVADLKRNAEDLLPYEPFHGGLERRPPVRDRAAREAADLAENRLGRHS